MIISLIVRLRTWVLWDWYLLKEIWLCKSKRWGESDVTGFAKIRVFNFERWSQIFVRQIFIIQLPMLQETLVNGLLKGYNHKIQLMKYERQLKDGKDYNRDDTRLYTGLLFFSRETNLVS